MQRSVRVLAVDDFAPFRDLVRSILLQLPQLKFIGEASDGMEAVRKAEELQPDLILLDIGLPVLNGLEAARRIGKVSPKSRILFVSANMSREIAEETLRLGAGGYVVKSNVASELLPAVESVLEGERFVSTCLAAGDLAGPRVAHLDDHHYREAWCDDSAAETANSESLGG